MELIEDKRPKCIDLFSGCGGFTLGMVMAGFNMVGHVEWDKWALKTYETNAPGFGFGNSELIGKDITKISDEQILKFKKKHRHINIIVGSPPCQGFSIAGKREIGDPRDNLFLHFVRFVNLIKPDHFLLENVPGMLTKRNDKGEVMIDVVLKAFELIDYKVEYGLLNAVNYEVPQTRRRVFIMGYKPDLEAPPFPFPICYGGGEGTSKLDKGESYIQYRKCMSCGKYYASYKIMEDSKKPMCFFCWEHKKDAEKGLLTPTLNLQKGWLIVPKNISIPAGIEHMYRILNIETRSNLFGASNFFHTLDIDNHSRWFKERDVRRIADNDDECDYAEAWIIQNQIIKPIIEEVKKDGDEKCS